MLASRVVHRLATLATLLALAAPAGAPAAEGLELWGEVGGGVDTNPERLAGEAAASRWFTSLLGRARLRLAGDAATAVVTVTEAGRLYPDARGADALASRAELAVRAGLGHGLSVAGSGVASDTSERAGLLDRHALRGEASVALGRGALDLALAGGWALFAPREASLRPFRSSGPEAWLRAGWALPGGHRLAAAVGASRADFPAWPPVGAQANPTRTDLAWHASGEWSWRGPALLSATFATTWNGSDAPGGDFTRHRLGASGALELPLEVTLAARLALQWTRYPDPLLLAAQQRLAEGQENLDALEVRLTRRVAGPIEASLAAAWYQAQGAAGVPGYRRAVATLALGWRLAAKAR